MNIQTYTPEDQVVLPIHHVPAAGGHFSLFREVGELRATSQYRTTGQAARTLVKRPELTIVLVVLARDVALKEHRVSQPVSIHTVAGAIELRAPLSSVEHIAGALHVLDPTVVHDVRALEDSAILLTIPWPDQRED